MNNRNGESARRLFDGSVTRNRGGADARTIGGDSPADAYVDRGFRYLEQENPEAALICFNRVLELEPNNPEGYNNAGYVHEMTDRLSSALYMYQKALALDEKNVEALINIAHIRDLEGDYYGALQHYQTAIAVEPDNINAV
jgi:tetratricopeptide (TPR) repeat protein